MTEAGTELITQFVITEEDRNKVVSAIAHTETRSAICKLRRMRALTPDEASLAMQKLASEMPRMVEQPITPALLQRANQFTDLYDLRALDSIQLASAVIARDVFQAPDMRFIASDQDLLAAAEAEGFPTWNPAP